MRGLATVAVAAVLFVAMAARADAIPIQCTNPPSDIDCAGTLDWNSGNNALTVTLTNTGTIGDIVAIALNFPGSGTVTGANYSVSYSGAPANFTEGLNGMQDFEFGATSPQDGLDPGETGTFIFAFNDLAFAGLTSASFVAPENRVPGDCNTSNNGKQEAWGCAHITRLPDTINGGSVFVRLAAQGETVPEPGTLLLLGAGLLTLGLLGRRALRK